MELNFYLKIEIKHKKINEHYDQNANKNTKSLTTTYTVHYIVSAQFCKPYIVDLKYPTIHCEKYCATDGH